jgi:hypothetical protein
MTSSITELAIPCAVSVKVTGDELAVELEDGRSLTVPIAWFPRLAHATVAERGNWRLIGRGAGIRWSDIDEDISVESLLAGRASQESQASLARWLKDRKTS